jgi:hypothetical protein
MISMKGEGLSVNVARFSFCVYTLHYHFLKNHNTVAKSGHSVKSLIHLVEEKYLGPLKFAKREAG